MIEIKYRIVEDIEKLLHTKPEIFDKDSGDFEGQIELNFNGSKIGYVYEEEISEEMLKVGCFQDQWLLLWFRHLIQAVNLLRENDYLILSEIERPNWMEFAKSDNSIRVKEFREIPLNINFKLSSRPIMSVTPLIEKIVLNTGEIYSKDVQMESTDFAETYITYFEFEHEVETKSKKLLEEIRKCFPNLTGSKAIKDFEEMICNINDAE